MHVSSDPIRKRLTRRCFVLGGLQAAAVSLLVGRTAQLQFLKSEQYKTLSEENRIRLQVTTPARGKLLDRYGEILAENRVNYRVLVERDNRKQALAGFDRLAELIALEEKKAAKLRKEIQSSHYHIPLLVADHLTWDEVVKIRANIPDLPSVYIEEGQLRWYPQKELTAHVTGYVGRVNEKEKNAEPELGRLPDFQIGKSGVEKTLEQELRGTAGSRRIEVNALGGNVRELAHTPFVPGDDIRLSIDLALQQYAAQRMGDESGSVVVSDIATGEVLACATMPAYDPNRFSTGISQAYWDELLNEPRKPLLNKAVSGAYPPGSVFKMVVALAALKAGVASSHNRVYCPGHYRLGNATFRCWKAGGHGSMNVKTALQNSCDTWFYTMGRDTGIQAIAEMSQLFGLGATTDLGLPGEKRGNIPTPEWKRETWDKPWVPGDTVNASIGQGYVLTTPAQLALMTARLVSGKNVQFSLRAGVSPEFASLDVPQEHLELVQEGMRLVTNVPGGTAYGSRIKQEGMAFAGKTGTAQVRRLQRRGVNQQSLPWEFRHHALFVGYAPLDAPRFAVSVVIEHGGGGSSAAAPVARDVLLKAQQLHQQRQVQA